MATIIPAGGLTPRNPSGQKKECPVPISLVVEVLEGMRYEVHELRPGVLGARCETHMPNLHVLTTPMGLDVRCWWETNTLADRASVMEAINEANLHAKTWRYSIDPEGDLLVDRAINFLGSGEVTADDLETIFVIGNMEMLMTMSAFLKKVMD